MNKKEKNPLLKVRTYTQRHRIETLLLQKKFDITKRTHFINDKLNSVSIDCKFTHECNVYYIKNKRLFEAARKKSHYVDLLQNDKAVTWDIPEKVEKERILFAYDAGHILFDYQGNPVPYLHSLHYIGTPFDNRTLHLNKAIKILKEHPDVVSVSEILSIESYNCEKDRNQYIRVDVLPSYEAYKKFYKRATRKNEKGKIKEFWSIRMANMVHDGHTPDRKNNYLGLYPEAVK